LVGGQAIGEGWPVIRVINNALGHQSLFQTIKRVTDFSYIFLTLDVVPFLIDQYFFNSIMKSLGYLVVRIQEQDCIKFHERFIILLIHLQTPNADQFFRDLLTTFLLKFGSFGKTSFFDRKKPLFGLCLFSIIVPLNWTG